MLIESQPILSLCTISLLLIATLAFAARGGTETTDNTSTPVTEGATPSSTLRQTSPSAGNGSDQPAAATIDFWGSAGARNLRMNLQ